MWTICSGIVVIFKLFAFALLTIWAIGMVVHGNTPKWFNAIFDLFFKFEED